MNKLLTALVAAGALSFAPLGLAETEMGNTLQTSPQEESTKLTSDKLTSDKLNDTEKHLEVNLKNNGKEFQAIVPHEHGKDLNQGDQLEVGDSLHKTDNTGTVKERNGID